jgi:RNA polymerase sigma-70 factor (ECF subfamily)
MSGGRHRFLTTQWSVVLAAAGDDTGEARDALTALCEAYWYPLYAFARRRGAQEPEAADLTQGFFAVLLEKDYVRAADRERGRFRTFLITAFRNYWSKEREKAGAQKRGGGHRHLSLDFEEGERRYRLEPSTDITPERVYERRWALTILDRALDRVRQHSAETGKAEQFEVLEPFLAAGSGRPAYAEVAEALGISESAIKSAIRRLRLRYRDALREEIAGTVPDESAVDAEIRHLMDALG